jgi:WD40 repeat protein
VEFTDGSALLRRASALCYNDIEGEIVVADKTGDVYSFPFPLTTDQQHKLNEITLPTEKDPLTKVTDTRFMGTFLLGHSSSVVDLTVTSVANGQRFLVTVDRDEHIRFSVFPETFVIHAMGLGHTAFVSAVITTSEGVISGGGDNRVLKWDFNGVVRGEYKITEGSCVRGLYEWDGQLFVVGEGSCMVEVLTEGLEVCQRITCDATVLDVTFHGDIMYVSLDAKEGDWIVEYRATTEGWTPINTGDKWQISKRKESAVVELYWLESMRKRAGMSEDE